MARSLGFVTALFAGLVAAAPAASQTITLSKAGAGLLGCRGRPESAPQSVSLTNPASGTLTWQITSTQPGWLQVGPAGGAAPASLTASVNIAGLPASTYRAEVSIASNDRVTPTKVLPVTLARVTAVDICSDRGRRGPNDDERVMCAATLVGTATMKVDLTIYNEEDRGGHLEASHDGGPFTSTVTGSCEAREQAQWRADYPGGNEGGGGSPNGQPIDEATSGSARLFTNGWGRLVVGTFPPSSPDGEGWTLRVITKLR